MKRKLLVLSLMTVLGLVCATESFAAGIPIPYCSKCLYSTQVADLPDSAQFYSEEYQGYVDLVYAYRQVWVVWLPLWNYDGNYYLGIKDKDVYFDIDEAELQDLAKTYNLDLPSNPIPLWDKIGGKAIVVILLAAIAWGAMSKDDEEESENTGEKEPAETTEVAK